MHCFSRSILRWGLSRALALGGATLLFPHHVKAGLAHVRAGAQSVIDRAVDNPVVLRQQLQELADEYPTRIATVRGEVAEVEHQIAQFERDCEVSQRVVAMTADDLAELKTLITRAEEVQGEANARLVAIRFEGVRFDIHQAYTEARRINHVRITYQDRLACNRQQLSVLGQQKARLVEILNTLGDEYATFQTQTWQLDRQIDTIQRNQRLIEMTEQPQATLDSYDRWGKIGNLKQLESKLAQLRTIQEAQLVTLAQQGIRHSYEEKARYELQTNDAAIDDPFGELLEDVDTESDADQPAPSADSMAWIGPIIVQ